MRDIDEIDLRLVDTTLLIVFLGIMRHRKATAVAREMGLTQPAVSHALKRLRALYGDPLFLRRAQGLEPTALARDLEPKIQKIVALITETLVDRAAFDPQITATTVRIAAFDYELATFLPELVTRLHKVSPNITIQAIGKADIESLDALTMGEIDLAVGYFDIPAQRAAEFIAEELCSEWYVVAARRGHPIFDGPLDAERFAAADHLLVSASGRAITSVDRELQRRGLQRRIRTTAPSLLGALSIIEQTDFVATLPARVAETFGARFRLEEAPLPFQVDPFSLHVVRHVRNAENPVLSWIVSVLDELQQDKFLNYL